MARTNNAKPTASKTAVEDVAVAGSAAVMEDAIIKQADDIAIDASVAKKTSSLPPLQKDDDIEIVSLIPNVSYKDTHTGDIYNWEDAGQVETLPFDVVQRMWQKHKTYFKSMWLKPLDERVIKKFALEGTYEKYDFLMDGRSYTQDNIGRICDSIVATPANLKLSLCNKIKSLVASGKITDIHVISAIERKLKIDLLALVQ